MRKSVIYGAGVYGELFCKELEANGVLIDYFIDQYTTKTTICEKKIQRLEDVSLNDVDIYISITSPKAQIEVFNTLNRLSPKKVVSFVDALKMFPNLLEKCLLLNKAWYTKKTSDMISNKEMQILRELLSDEKSGLLLERIIKFRETLSPEYYPIPDSTPQYFASDIDLLGMIESIRFIDGGAFVGDTIASTIDELTKASKTIEYIACFEPDVKNIEQLRTEIIKQKSEYPEINFFIYPCGLWSSNTFAVFNNNCGSSSSMIKKVSEYETQIMALSLDQSLAGANPNFIKLDIEGAEKEAIKGMASIISSTSPVLAISLYHRPQDLWELPLLINRINKNYDMYLRIYGSMGLELVLYCVPKKE